MKTATEMLVELTEAAENYNSARGCWLYPAGCPEKTQQELKAEMDQAYVALQKSMRRARSRLNHRDTLETAGNRLLKQREALREEASRGIR